MEVFTPDGQPPHAGEESTESSISGVRDPGSQARANVNAGAVFVVQHPGRPAGDDAADGSAFRLRHPGSGQIPGRIPGGRPPVRASAASSRLTAAAASPAVPAKKKQSITPNESASKIQEAQDLAISAASSSQSQVVESGWTGSRTNIKILAQLMLRASGLVLKTYRRECRAWHCDGVVFLPLQIWKKNKEATGHLLLLEVFCRYNKLSLLLKLNFVSRPSVMLSFELFESNISTRYLLFVSVCRVVTPSLLSYW